MSESKNSPQAYQRLICVRCLYTADHPLGLILDKEGICSGCRVHEEKNSLDWDVRWTLLKSLVSPYRIKSGKTYDCIVPVTGGNDSYYIVDQVKKKLGLNPLLVTYNKYFNTPLGIRNLANLRIQFDCDILVQNVNPIAVKNITRTTLREFGSMYWPCLAGQTVFPVQTAVRYGIPLIIWGAHQGLEQVGMFSHEHEVEMTRRYRKDHDLMGHEADDLLSIFDTLSEDDIWQYRYPSDAELARIGVRGIYLGNYVRWDPKAQHEQMIAKYGYQTSGFARTFDTYDHVDCYNFMGLHDQIKYYKQGYGKVTDHACREIRHGRLSREQAKLLVSQHSSQAANYIDLFCQWLEIDKQALQFTLDQHRNLKFWAQETPNVWTYRAKESYVGLNETESCTSNLSFNASHDINLDQHTAYITIGKGYP
jgi:N-acetyl sugar amidotransferase